MKKSGKIFLFVFVLLCGALLATFYNMKNNSHAKAAETPIVQLFVGNPDNIVESGTVTNQKFGIVVDKPGYIYIRLPNNQSASRNITSSYLYSYTLNGTYTVYRFVPDNEPDNYIDLNLQIVIDTVLPIVIVESNGASLSNNSFININTIKFTVDKSNSTGYVYTLSTNEIFKISNGSEFTNEDTYTFWAIDSAGNKSLDTYITIDRTAPIGNIFTDNVLITAAYTNAENIKYIATDKNDFSIYIKLPESDTYILTENSLPFTTEGEYSFYVEDAAKNQSAVQTITIDRVKPIITLYANTNTVNNDSFVNTVNISATASDNVSGVKKLYVKFPDEISFIKYTTGTKLSNEGTYSFFCEDYAGNSSDIKTIHLDKTGPVGIVTANGIDVENNNFTNKTFSYSATDNLSGVLRLEIKKPNGNWESYVSGTNVIGIDGLYSFRAYDVLNNVSSVTTITLDTEKPILQVLGNGITKDNNTFSNAATLQFSAFDTNLLDCYIKLPGEVNFKSVFSGTAYSAAGKYEFYALDKAGNQSDTFIITLDKAAPVGILNTDNKDVLNNSYTNKPFKYTATDDYSGVEKLEIKKPNGVWEIYDGALIPISSTEGKYSFRSIDNVGNLSTESIIFLDKTAPVGTLFAEEISITSGSFTNALRIKFVCIDNELDACFVKKPNSTSFETTSSGALYSEVGKYEFYTTDKAGNESAVYILTIDRTPKNVNLTNVANEKTNQNVAVSWENIVALAPVISVKINGKIVENTSVINTVNGGRYEVVCVDTAGNISTQIFTAIRIDIETKTSNKYWWEAKSFEGETYAFETYENALAFTTQREKALIKALTWNGDTWDTGYIMDSVDSANAKQGSFYVYKKQDNPNIEVAYFTLNRLNSVIKSYAEKDINHFFYWQKTPAISYDGNNLYKPSDNNKITSKSVNIRANLTYKVDDITLSGTTFNTPGHHTLTVFDEYENTVIYDLCIISAAPDLHFRYGNGDYYLAYNEQPYYLKNRITIKVIDTLDEFAMAVVRNSKGEIVYTVNLGEELIISEAGKYVIQTINHGQMKEYIYFISYDNPSANTVKNSTTKRLEATITPSKDRDITLLTIKIFRSLDSINWEQLTVDDYGLTIALSNLKYSFYITGYYKIVVEDICRSGIDAIVYETYYVKPAPTGTLIGVNENGYSNNAVIFKWTDEAFVNLFINGVETEYSSGTELTEEGEYRLIFRDLNGYSKEYNFVIDKTAAEVILSAEIQNGYSRENISIDWKKENVNAVLYKNGEIIGGYEKGTELDKDGQYRLILTDLASNENTIDFTIDKTAPTISLGGVENNSKTKGKIQLSSLSETANIAAYFNGQRIEITDKSVLNKVGKYTIMLTDEAGNVSEYNFEILYSVNAAGIIFIMLLIAAIIGGAVLIIYARKKNKFKTKRTAK